MTVDQLSVEDQIRLLELGIETQILTEEELTRLIDIGIITPVNNVVITSNCNIGIGTTAPTQKLHIDSNTTIPANHDSTDFDK